MARTGAREIAFCLLFERSYNITTRTEDYKELFDDVELNAKDIQYINSVLSTYETNKEEIDGAISQNSLNWKLSRIPRADLSILRLAICEMVYVNDVPVKVAINEAINLSKRYCEEDSPSFINGVLDGCMKKL